MPATWRPVDSQLYEGTLMIEGTDGRTVRIGDGEPMPVYNYLVHRNRDGCINFSTFANGYAWDHVCPAETCPCYREELHICDLADFMDSLAALNDAIAVEHDRRA